jgi:hypothetical protein
MVCVLLLFVFPAGLLFAQEPAPPAQSSPPAQPLSPDQLDTLVAPVALYPDALLSEVLVAATYPLEVAEAPQWLQQNRNLQGQQLMDAARQQNWDPSIQALVAFPDVINRLSSNIRWTTDLGNAFLAQQADVMNAVQRMRARARAAGKLNSNDQETVTTETQGDRNAIEIQPANPDVVYVPQYNPEYVWGPPDYGYYPPMYYPDYGFGYGFGPGIYIGGFFGGLGWGGWGWGPNWFNCSIFQNYSFFNHYGFRGLYGGGGFGGGGFGGRGIWAHDPMHRMGVAYPNRGLASRYGGAANLANRGNVGANGAQRGATAGGINRGQSSQSQPGGRSLASQGNRAATGNWQRFGGSGAGTSQGQRGAPAARQSMNAAPATRSGGSQWSHFGGSGSQPGYRSILRWQLRRKPRRAQLSLQPIVRRRVSLRSFVPLGSFLRWQLRRKPQHAQLSLQPVVRRRVSLGSFPRRGWRRRRRWLPWRWRRWQFPRRRRRLPQRAPLVPPGCDYASV